MKGYMKKLLVAVVGLILVASVYGVARARQQSSHSSSQTNQTRSVKASKMRQPISYIKSSEVKPYPRKLNAKRDRIIVSLKKQRAYLMQGNKMLYEFYVSTGKNVKGRRTPTGNYRINNHRIKWFYDAKEHEGARYAVGWHDGGLYLFHETPSDRHGKIIRSVAKQLGKRGSSYGCVHLSVSDARWFYSHAPTGMRVIIK